MQLPQPVNNLKLIKPGSVNSVSERYSKYFFISILFSRFSCNASLPINNCDIVDFDQKYPPDLLQNYFLNILIKI